MTATLLDGKSVAQEIRAELGSRVAAVKQKLGRPPTLAIVLVGDDPASQVYVRSKLKTAQETGMEVRHDRLPATATLAELVALARSRWPIEQQYRELKDDLGLDHFEGRTYPGWTHHVVLTAVAFTFLQIERGRATDGPRPTLPVVRGWVREIMGLLYVLHNRRLLGMLDSFRRNPPRRR